MALHIVILAAGQGTRMRSRLPKVLQPLGDRPLLGHVAAAAAALSPERVHVVYGHGGAQVKSALGYLDVNWVLQEQQLGTGHAVARAMTGIGDDAQVLVLYGDVPLVQAATLQRLIDSSGEQALALLTLHMDNPSGYGRILRDDDGAVIGIVEDKDATDEQRQIREINTGLLCAPAARLRSWLSRVGNDNVQGEYYLPDCVESAIADGVPVVADQPETPNEVQGINNKRELALAERMLQRRQADVLMDAGLTLRDPNRFDLRGSLAAGRDCMIDVNCVFVGDVVLGDDVHVGPNCMLRDCRIGSGTRVYANTIIDHAVIGDGCQVGPFARLRPDTHVADRAKIGNFVETKKITLGSGSKVNHLSYVGDAHVGRGVNIGAGVITCNYDGANKHLTEIGDDAFIGSNVQLVAPVKVGAGATIGAGSTITQTAPEQKLTLSRARQFTVDNWARPSKDET